MSKNEIPISNKIKKEINSQIKEGLKLKEFDKRYHNIVKDAIKGWLK